MVKASQDDISNHRKVKLTEIDVLRELDLTHERCLDEQQIRKFCSTQEARTSTGRRTLPDMIEIEAIPYDDDNDKFQWHIIVWENPNVKEGV